MKPKIRQLVRNGWHLVEVKNISTETGPFSNAPLKNAKQYRALCSWCLANVPDKEWYSSSVSTNDWSKVNTKRFAFKDEKYAAWFKLITT